MAGAGGDERQFDGFQVTQFSDEDDVGILAQGAAQGGGKTSWYGRRLRGD